MFLTRVFPYYQRRSIFNKNMNNDILDILAELHHKGRNHQMGRDFYDWIPDGDGKVSESNYIAVIMFNTISLFVILLIS